MPTAGENTRSVTVLFVVVSVAGPARPVIVVPKKSLSPVFLTNFTTSLAASFGSLAISTVPPPGFSNTPKPMPAAEKSVQLGAAQVPVLPDDPLTNVTSSK